MSKRKRQPEAFDVGEFLRESDDDLKSALNSLLRVPEVVEADPVSLESESNLIPDPSLNRAEIREESELASEPNLGPPLKLIPPPSDGGGKRQFAIREMKRAEDAHTRAEQHVWKSLWENGSAYDEVSRTITIGFGGLAKLVGLSESNARINLRSLIAKLAVEEIAEYNCERSVGRTYRVFTEAEILRRRREAGLVWFMRRTLAVVFVDPATGEPLLKRKPLLRQDRALN